MQCNYSLRPQIYEFLESVLVELFLILTNFVEKSNNIYDVKWVHYENIFYIISNDTNLIP